MGGCASRPRELSTKEETPLPDDRDVPAADAAGPPNEPDTVAQEEGNAVEARKEEDDISKPAAEEPSAESKPAELEEAKKPSEEPAAESKAEPVPVPAPAPTPAPAEEARAPSSENKSDAPLVNL